ncbi:MAG TPA: HNH endonuclease, partial [Kamptonema sp.]|nr:HNH endonuclease [Kamptonema sp.]
MGNVLVLNASYEPLNITSWRRAVVLLLKGKAEQIEHNGKFLS